MRAARTGYESYTRFGQAKTSMVGGNNEIAGERYLEASTQGNAVHRGNERFVALERGCDPTERRHLVRHLLAPGCRRSGCLEVVSCRECSLTRTRQDGDPGVVILLKIVEDFAQLDIGVVVEGVHDLGTIDRHVGNMVLFLVNHVLVVCQNIPPWLVNAHATRITLRKYMVLRGSPLLLAFCKRRASLFLPGDHRVERLDLSPIDTKRIDFQ